MPDDRPPSRAKGPYGRETSFGRDTSGYKGWIPVDFYEGKNPDGSIKSRPGFKSVLNNQEIMNPEPPYPTGELVRHASDAYREGYSRIRWNK